MQWPFRAFPMLAQRPGCVKGAGGILPFGANDVHFAHASSQISWRIFPAFGQGRRHRRDAFLHAGPGGAKASRLQQLDNTFQPRAEARRVAPRPLPRSSGPSPPSWPCRGHAGRPRPGGPSGRARRRARSGCRSAGTGRRTAAAFGHRRAGTKQVEISLRRFPQGLLRLKRPQERQAAITALELASATENISPAHKHMFRDFGAKLRAKRHAGSTATAFRQTGSGTLSRRTTTPFQPGPHPLRHGRIQQNR